MRFLGIYQENTGRHLVRLEQDESDLTQLVVTYPDGQTRHTTPHQWTHCERHHYTRMPTLHISAHEHRESAPVPVSRIHALLELLKTEGDYELTIEINFDLQQNSAADAKRSKAQPAQVGIRRSWERDPERRWADHYGEFSLLCGRKDGRWRSQLLPHFEKSDDDDPEWELLCGAPLTNWRDQEGASDPLSLLLALLAGRAADQGPAWLPAEQR